MKKVEGKIQISHIHTVPKSTNESQAQITHLLTAPEPARGSIFSEGFTETMGTEIYFQLVGWSLTSLFSTNMAISETNLFSVNGSLKYSALESIFSE